MFIYSHYIAFKKLYLVAATVLDLSIQYSQGVSLENPHIKAALDQIGDPTHRTEVWHATKDILRQNKDRLRRFDKNFNEVDFCVKTIEDIGQIPTGHWFFQ
jgi:hypothetical protein